MSTSSSLQLAFSQTLVCVLKPDHEGRKFAFCKQRSRLPGNRFFRRAPGTSTRAPASSLTGRRLLSSSIFDRKKPEWAWNASAKPLPCMLICPFLGPGPYCNRFLAHFPIEWSKPH